MVADECKEGVEDDSQDSGMEDWMVPFTNVIEMMEEVGVAGPGSSRNGFSVGQISVPYA